MLEGIGLDDDDDDDDLGSGSKKKGKRGGAKKGKAGGGGDGGGGGGGGGGDEDGGDGEGGGAAAAADTALLEALETALRTAKPSMNEMPELASTLAARLLPSAKAQVAEALKAKREAGAGERRRATQAAQEQASHLAINVQVRSLPECLQLMALIAP